MKTNALQILYADGTVIVCVKPAGLSSEEDVPARLAEQTGIPRAEIRCVHRLDTAVGGAMVYAGTRAAAAALSRAITGGRFEKRYLAVCAGRPEPPAGELRDLLFRDARSNKSFVVARARRGVREAVLAYRVLDAREGASLVEVRLETGRSHQIRVQFASRKLPLLGDGKYGSRIRCGGPALWSYRLAFPSPDTGETLRFAAPPPEVWPWTMFGWKEGAYAEFQAGPEL